MKKGRKVAAKQEESSMTKDLAQVGRGSVFAVLLTLLCIILFAVIMQLSSLTESIIRPVVQVVRILSIAVGGIYAAGKGVRRGWLKGAGTGILYVILVSLIGIFSGGKFAFDRIFLSDMIMAIIVGTVGGAIGINLR
jgi:putative membrane protein (TIGR04086 family)